MANHRFKTSFGQCECLWCHQARRMGGFFDCPVNDNIRAALADFAKIEGRTWRRKLIDAWTAGTDLGPELQAARNILGPTRLMKIPTIIIQGYQAKMAADQKIGSESI